MNIKNLLYNIIPPCPQCPYTLGLVQTMVNPCPECKAGGYQAFQQFQQKMQSTNKH